MGIWDSRLPGFNENCRVVKYGGQVFDILNLDFVILIELEGFIIKYPVLIERTLPDIIVCHPHHPSAMGMTFPPTETWITPSFALACKYSDEGLPISYPCPVVISIESDPQ